MKLFWTGPARQDRRLIYQHIEADNPRAALMLDDVFSAKAARLIETPCLGRPGVVDGTRELVAHRNYVLVYDVRPDRVRILRVLHVARQWPAS